ncbi:MAG TPA: SH3 domain-containing protein [Devosia sp.]|jgi:hypothetical protein|nr:SH3 domain-containing protein [Devosia sp.]
MLSLGRLFLVVTTLLFGAASGVMASERGTHAWSTDPLTLFAGPGTAYDVTGFIAEDLPIMVLRCTELWCHVDGPGGRGWSVKQSISFGLSPDDWPFDIHPDYPSGGVICLYTGTHYTGAELCLGTGRVVHDFQLLGLDNVFSSVKVFDTSAAACRDRDFQSYCERIIDSQPVLDQYLVRALSSIRVY